MFTLPLSCLLTLCWPTQRTSAANPQPVSVSEFSTQFSRFDIGGNGTPLGLVGGLNPPDVTRFLASNGSWLVPSPPAQFFMVNKTANGTATEFANAISPEPISVTVPGLGIGSPSSPFLFALTSGTGHEYTCQVTGVYTITFTCSFTSNTDARSFVFTMIRSSSPSFATTTEIYVPTNSQSHTVSLTLTTNVVIGETIQPRIKSPGWMIAGESVTVQNYSLSYVRLGILGS